jgi:hypothetical protein
MKKAIQALGLPDNGGREWESRANLELGALHDSNLGDESKLKFRFVLFKCITKTKNFQDFCKKEYVY